MGRDNLVFQNERQVQLDKINRELDWMESKMTDALCKFTGEEAEGSADKMKYDILQAYVSKFKGRVRDLKCSCSIRDISAFFSKDEQKEYNKRLKNYTAETEQEVKKELMKRIKPYCEDIVRELGGLDIDFFIDSFGEGIRMLYLSSGEIAFEFIQFKFTVNIA